MKRNQTSNCQHSLTHRESKRIHKNICFIDCGKAFDCVDHNKLWKIQHGNIRPPYLSPEKPVIQVKKQQLEPDKEQKTGSKLGNE